MQDTSESPLTIVLIADDTLSIAMLRRAVRAAGIACTLHRVPPTAGARAFLRPKTPGGARTAPDLVLCDFAATDAASCSTVRAVAFGRQRSPAPVVLLTTDASEAVLESGELDGGKATMFAARPLPFILGKLGGEGRRAFLGALTTLYQYGPILARHPRAFLRYGEGVTELSA